MPFIGAKIFVRGIVQGVGFRPFIHKQVEKYGLKGWVRNNSLGADLALEGEETLIDRFLAELPEECVTKLYYGYRNYRK
jgi:hydrogenase maturation protein HypF